jgi:hypothetical protein
MAVVTPLNNPGGPEGDTVTVDEQLLNTEYWCGGGSINSVKRSNNPQGVSTLPTLQFYVSAKNPKVCSPPLSAMKTTWCAP